jgi:AP-1 complex subunit beta-1
MELKKLVYLYLINYAKTNPDMAIMAVNTFVKDTTHPSPLIRALAVRTMGCIRVDRITEYLCDPLKRALADPVRRVRAQWVRGRGRALTAAPLRCCGTRTRT